MLNIIKAGLDREWHVTGIVAGDCDAFNGAILEKVLN